MNKQNAWETPKLIVLGRGTPEEHVLDFCKNWGTNGPSAILERCRVHTGKCATRTSS